MKQWSIFFIVLLPLLFAIGYSANQTVEHLATADLVRCSAVYKVFYDRKISQLFYDHPVQRELLEFFSLIY